MIRSASGFPGVNAQRLPKAAERALRHAIVAFPDEMI